MRRLIVPLALGLILLIVVEVDLFVTNSFENARLRLSVGLDGKDYELASKIAFEGYDYDTGEYLIELANMDENYSAPEEIQEKMFPEMVELALVAAIDEFTQNQPVSEPMLIRKAVSLLSLGDMELVSEVMGVIGYLNPNSYDLEKLRIATLSFQ